MKAITLVPYFNGVGWAFQAKAAEKFASVFFWLIVAFSRRENETETPAGGRTGDAYPSVPQLLIRTGHHKTKPIVVVGAQ